MTDTPQQGEATTPPADDKGTQVHPNSMNPHAIPEKEETEKAAEE